MTNPVAGEDSSGTRALRVAYLVSQYPKLSHAFIEREIRALRRLGVEVDTFSVRATPPSELLGSLDREEARSTTALQSRRRVAAALFRLLRSHPGPVLQTLGTALGTGPRTLRARLWQVFYLAEAAVLVMEMRARGLRHVHVHLANNGADVARLAVALGSRTEPERWSWSLSMHGPTEFANVDTFDLAAKVRSAAFVACISDYCRSQLMMLVDPEQWDKLALVRMSVDLTHYPLAMGQRAGRSGALRVLFVGRLTPEKAPHLLVEAAARLPRGSVTVRLVGAGDEQSLRELVAERELTRVVEILGPRGQDELPGLYAWADVFCLPSFAEGVPVVLMEAMATGLPVISTAITGIPELVRDGESGVLVTPGRSDLVAQALSALARDPGLRAAMGAAGRERVEAEFTPGPNALALRELLTAYATR